MKQIRGLKLLMLSQSKDLPNPVLNSIGFLPIKVNHEWKQKIENSDLRKICICLDFSHFYYSLHILVDENLNTW